VRDVCTMQIGRVIYTGATFAASIFFARILGIEQYGLYAVVLAFISTLKAFTNLGQSTTLLVFFAEEYGKKNRKGMACVLKNFLQVSLVHIMLLGALAISARTLSIIFYDNVAIGSFAIAIFIFHMFEIANSGMLLILQAVRRIKLKTIMEQSAVIIALTLGIISLLLGYGIWGIIISQLITSIVFVIISSVVYRKMMKEYGLPGLRETLCVKSQETHEYLKQGLWFAVDKSIGNLYPNGFLFVLSLVAPVSTIGIARIAVQLASLSGSLVLPQVAELSTTVLANMKVQGMDVLRKNVLRVLKHSLLLHITFSLGAIIILPFLIPLFYGQEYAAAIPMTIWMIFIGMLSGLNVNNTPLLRLFRKTYVSTSWSAISISLSCIMLYMMLQNFSPTSALVASIALYYLINQGITRYVYFVLLKNNFHA
jgi:O-antigen/teichoic acid export membrane protein